jgi:hypothetical protein
MSIESVIDSLRASEAIHTREAFLHRCRMEIEPFVYSYLNHTYGEALSRHWSTCTIPRKSTKGIVIVERRCHPNLEFTIQNAIYFAPGYSLHIICSDANQGFVEEICGSQLDSVHIHSVFKDIGTPESGKKEYNTLLKDWGFWSLFPEDWLLCMETDSYLLKEIPEKVYKYNYLASKWAWFPEKAGGGGISHRKRSFMLEICSNTSLTHEMQDCFASDGVALLGCQVIDSNIFGETCFDSSTIGTHQWWTFACDIPKEDLREYLNLLLTLYIKLDRGCSSTGKSP